ncbi:hypothetical protein D3C80_1612320 [compost metagenome]
MRVTKGAAKEIDPFTKVLGTTVGRRHIHAFMAADNMTGVVMRNISVSTKIHAVIKTGDIQVINGEIPQQAFL